MNEQAWSAKRPIMIGMIALGILVFFLGAWSVGANIAGAVISTGVVEVESNRQVIQHPDGGVVSEILARDGDSVEAGQVLLKFDAAALRSELAIVEGRYFEILARSARLEAERDNADTVTYPDMLLDRAIRVPVVQEQLDGQSSLFEARRATMSQQVEQLREQRNQTEDRIDGVQAQLDALMVQNDLIGEEVETQANLRQRGLTAESTVSALRREQARLSGEIGNMQSTIAQLNGDISRLTMEEIGLGATRREAAITELRDLESTEIELAERRLALSEQLNRLEVRSPVSGIVYGSRVFAPRSVVTPTAPILHIVPQDQPLIVRVRVDPLHVDQVSVGQEVQLQFTSLDQRTTPQISGNVTDVSADVLQDQATGAQYFSASIRMNPEDLQSIGVEQIVPGMPVYAFILTGERTPLAYLTQPLTDYFGRAFRE